VLLTAENLELKYMVTHVSILLLNYYHLDLLSSPMVKSKKMKKVRFGYELLHTLHEVWPLLSPQDNKQLG